MKLIIDGDNINTLEDFYEQIEKYLDKGECTWTRDLDTLQELVLNAFNCSGEPKRNITEIIWFNHVHAKHRLGQSETINWWKSKRNDINNSPVNQYIEQKVAGLRQGKEKTLFEIICDILGANDQIKFQKM